MSQQINLYRDPRRRVRQPVDSLHMILTVGLVAVILAALTAHGAWRANTLEREAEILAAEQDTLDARVSELADELRAARADLADTDELERLRAELDAKHRLLDYLDAGPLAERSGFSHHVEGLARRVVDDLWLTTIRLSEGGRQLRLHGRALAAERVPELMTALGREAAYSGHVFRRLRIQRSEDEPGQIRFEIASEPEDDPDSREGGR